MTRASIFLWAICIPTLIVLISLTSVVRSANDEGPTGKKTLAILDDLRIKSSHATFFRNLEDRGYQITYLAASDKATFQKYGEWQYDHLILFAPSAESLAGIKPDDIVAFIDAGHNVFIGASSSLSEPIREIASQCNVEFDEEDTYVIDHFNYDVSDADGDHTLLVCDRFDSAAAKIVLGAEDSSTLAPVLFRGIGQDIEEDSPLLYSLVSGYPTSYSHALREPIEESVHVAGTRTSLVTILNARNNARVVFSGSLEMFSDKLFNSPVQKYSADNKSQRFDRSGNEQFATKLAQWTFQERGILRVSNVQHHRVGETAAPETYTIKEDVVYSATIEEWNGKRWVPYISKNVYLEFQMLDPYVRTELKPSENGTYTVQFKLPDVYGIFTFRLVHNRKGYTGLNHITRAPVRPFRHNEYERFIYSAYPYYASELSMLVGLFIFSWVFLYHRETKPVAPQTR